MKGVWPEEYLSNPNPNKTIQEIWDIFDAYSFEETYENEDMQKDIHFVVPLPPLYYDGKFVKGFCFSHTMGLLNNKMPKIKDLFVTCANSMTFSYPWSRGTDAFFTCYKHPGREKYYKEKYPETKDVVCLPLQDADYTNEKVMVPISGVEKDIDVFCMSTPFPVKNMPIIAQALKLYEEKYGKVLKVTYALGRNDVKKLPDGSIDYSELIPYGKQEMEKVKQILGDMNKYIDFIPYITYWDLPKYFSRSKVAVLASLYEGKNRFIFEAQSCDVPVIVFKDFNKFMRKGNAFCSKKAGEYVPEFSPESLADTIHHVLNNLDKYKPRNEYLKYNGRRNFIKTIVNEIPYYKENIPDLNDGDLIYNEWVNKACRENYFMTYEEFLYDFDASLSHVVSADSALALVEKYYQQFYQKNVFGNFKKPTLFEKVKSFFKK